MLGKNSFRTIRSFGTGPEGAFEELICQIAHLDAPRDGKAFVRKEGSGGDAGVECFWILADGSEHAWQAKYYLDEISPPRWGKIDESVATALKSHPSLKKYYVCIPLDRTDTRTTGPRGKKTISVLDEWNEHVKKWTLLAHSQGMTVDFEYWGAHEILLPLQSDDPRYSGRALYWFNSVVLTKEKLTRCIEKQEKTLGERYTPEFHVDLPIAKTLDGLANSEQFWLELNQRLLHWNKELSTFQQKVPPKELGSRFIELNAVLGPVKELIDSVVLTHDRNRLSEIQRELKKATSYLDDFEDACRDSAEASTRPNQYTRSYQDDVANFAYHQHPRFVAFVNSDYVNANIASAILITGAAGAGKSHLFCDFAKSFNNLGGPAVLMLGQHYRGGNPLAELLDLLDLIGHSYQTVLGAIDAAGEAAKINAVVLIDAINEGNHREEWRERIVGLLEDLKPFRHISLAISCRSRFDVLLVPEHIEQTELLRVAHEGFRGHENKAALVYLSGQGISKPSAPITAPEFSNPLFLKTCATALKQLGHTSWPKGYQGSSRLFEIYLSSLEEVVSRRRRTEPNDKLCQKALEALANELFPNHLFGLPWDKATQVVNAVDTCVNPSESLLQTLLREGALAEEIEHCKRSDGSYVPTSVVRFAYERFCDQFVAQKLVHAVKDPAEIFKDGHPLTVAIATNGQFECRGILAALSIIVPELFGKELWDLLPPQIKRNSQSADFYFCDSLPYRAPSSFTDRTWDLFKSLRSPAYAFRNRQFDILVQLATEPDHPWNGERLHSILANKKLPERDSLWSTYVAKNDHEQADEEPESAIRSIIEWGTFADLSTVEEDRAFLSLVTLTWFTTTTNRRTRDQATKAASRLFARYPSAVVPLLEKFQGVDDLYLQERLYASAYGGLCNATSDEQLRLASKRVFETLFRDNSPTTHILLRDYARGIIELALVRQCLDETIVIEKCRPPYKSEWPLEDPPVSDSSRYANRIEYSVFSDDFGTYTMSAVDKWSPTSIGQERPESQSEVLAALMRELDEPSKELFDRAVKATQSQEAEHLRHLISDYEAVEDEIEDLSTDLQEAPTDHSNSVDGDSDCAVPDKVDAAWERFKGSLDASAREKFRWAQSFWRNGKITASFNREWAKRWVCRYALELGWTAELFETFEASRPYDGRDRPRIERIGKKYQRIAFHKFLAHLSDNVHYKDEEGYGDTPHPSRYRGPWQLWKRDIDPTHWMRRTSDDGWGEWTANVWWRPFHFTFVRTSDGAKRRWCEDPSDLPSFDTHIRVSDETNNTWYSLRGFSKWREERISGDTAELNRDIWFRINSIIVKKGDLRRIQRELKGRDFISPHLVASTSTFHQGYIREFPWHPAATIQDQFAEDEAWEIKSPHVIPYAEYEWEKGSGDQSTEMNLSLYMPSSSVIEKMGLRYDRSRFDRWTDGAGQTAFLDPSLEFDGPSFALLDCKLVDKMLSQQGLVLMWLIGGEKMLMDENSMTVEARMVFNTMLWTSGDGKISSTSRHYMEGSK